MLWTTDGEICLSYCYSPSLLGSTKTLRATKKGIFILIERDHIETITSDSENLSKSIETC